MRKNYYISFYFCLNWFVVVVVRMLEACKTAEEVESLSRNGQAMLARMEANPKPIVAAIMGSCLGGGFEVS